MACYNNLMAPIVTSNPNIMHGTPCFAGTRVSVQSLFDHLEAGYTVNEFLAEFPTVAREQVAAAKTEASARILTVEVDLLFIRFLLIQTKPT